MNGRHHDYPMYVAMPRDLKLLRSVMVSLFAIMSANAGPTDPDRIAAIPTLQRVKIFENKALSFDFTGPRGPRIPRLLAIAEALDGPVATQPVFYYIFATLQGANDPDFPLRWGCADGVVFCTMKYPAIHEPTGPTLQRFPIDAIVVKPDDGCSPFDSTKLGNRYTSPSDGGPPPHYVGCGPVAMALQGRHRWKGERGGGDPVKQVFLDIRALDDTQVELYMTGDGQLVKWLFDGATWKYIRTYDLRLNGEFMALEGDTMLVAVQDNRWCAFSGFEDGEAKVTPIAEVDDHEPMTVVDDVDAKRSFLHFKDTLYDAEGRAVQRIAAGLASAEKVRELANAVRKHRPNERGK